MIKIGDKDYKVIDAHMHVWNNFDGQRFGNAKVIPLGYGMVKQGNDVFRLIPPTFQDNQVPIEVMEAMMTDVGIDKGVILQNPCYGDQRDYVKEIVDKSNGKFVALGLIDPRDKQEVVRQMDILFNDYKFKGFKIEVPDVPFILDSFEYDFLWKKIVDMGAIITFDLGWNDGPFDFNIDRLTNVVKKYPDMRMVLCHLGVSRLWDPNQIYPYPHLQKTLKLLDSNRDNLYMDIAYLLDFDPSKEYPYYKSLDILKTVKEFYGLDKIMWGSDAPMALRDATYGQTLTHITKYCDFLSEQELEKLLYSNAQKVYF